MMANTVIPAKAGIRYGNAGRKGDASGSCLDAIDPGLPLRRGDGGQRGDGLQRWLLGSLRHGAELQ
jgi:hypothetical protein